MSKTIFPMLGQLAAKGSFKTEPALRAGAELPQSSTLIVGQREANPDPKAAMLLGKVVEQTASKNFFNWAVWLDVTFPHVMLIAGKRGSGKSYDLGIIAEGLCAKNSDIGFGTDDFAMVLFDTQSQFWTLAVDAALPPAQEQALRQWKLSPAGLTKPTVFKPRGTPSIGSFEVDFSIRPSDLEPDDWTALCELDRFSAMGQCLRAGRLAMREAFEVGELSAWFSSDEARERFPTSTLEAVTWRIEAIRDTELFDPYASDIVERLAAPGSKSIIELADLDDDTKGVVVAIIMRRLLRWAGPAQRRRKVNAVDGDTVNPAETLAPRIWTLIDEAHLVCPAGRPTAARPVIVDYVKRGRDAGLSLVMATQQPSALDTAAISQCDIVAVHKLTIDHDIDAATARMPARAPSRASKLPSSADIGRMDELARSLDSGQSLFADAESTRAFVVQSRPRVTPHGGGEPEL